MPCVAFVQSDVELVDIESVTPQLDARWGIGHSSEDSSQTRDHIAQCFIWNKP